MKDFEVKYRKRIYSWNLVKILLGPVLVYVGILDIISHAEILFFSILITFYGIVTALSGFMSAYFDYCYFNKTQTILDEEGLSYIGKELSRIKWEDIVEVDTKFVSTTYRRNALLGTIGMIFFKDRFDIIIRTEDLNIRIGSHAENIRAAIEYIKNKVGTKFKTTSIPAEFKYKQYKDGLLK